MNLEVTTLCFAASYAVALAVELAALRFHVPARRAWLLVVTAAGLVAHTLYLAKRVEETQLAPLASSADWLLLAAWVLAVTYMAAAVYLPRAASGLFLLPLVLVLIGASLAASDEPFAPERASRFWGGLHGSVLLLATATVSVGFAAGMMYLLQSYWLKRHRVPGTELRLPSLELLERINTAALAISAIFVGLGFVSGLVLSQLRHRGEVDYHLWADPVVWSLAAMLIWLVAAEVFRLVYPAARRGRKVAYLTLASFVFLVIALASFVFVDTVHGPTNHSPNSAKAAGQVE
jgi:ABC-type uncharacterized transport system permease subunit